MPDYEAPPGPPPPKVPEGWAARWNDQYKEWFYVNTFTKKSQWEKPTVAARPADDDAPDGPPPSYTPSDRPAPSDVKRNPYDDDDNDDTRDAKAGTSKAAQEDEDARLARQLQDEEDARARSPAGSAASYPNTPLPPGSNPFPDELPPRDDTRGDKSRGLLGKLFGKKPSSQQQYPGAGYAGGAYGQQQPPFGAPQGYYGGGPPPQGYGGYGPPPGGYYGGGPPPGGYYGGGGYAEPQGRTGRSGGLGTAGGLALGAGAGLLGGMLISDVIEDHDQSMYQQGFDQGEMADGGGGGGYGDGGDFGGGGGF